MSGGFGTQPEELDAIGREGDALRSFGDALRGAARAYREGDDAGAAELRRSGTG